MFKILIADDESMMRATISNMLARHGDKISEIITACDGLEVMTKTKEHSPDIIIIDINMPMLDGLTAISKIREHNSEVAIIIISGYSLFEYAQAAIQNKVNAYLLKPVDADLFDKTLLGCFAELSGGEKQEQSHDVEGDYKKYIAENMTNPDLNIEAVCAHFFISPSSLTRKLKKDVGLHFTDYLTKVRITSAMIMLKEQKSIPIKEIAIAVGYKNQHYFSRAFKNYTGLSPKTYRDSV